MAKYRFATYAALLGVLMCASTGTRAQSGFTDLGLLNNGSHSVAFGVSQDGTAVVGWGGDGAVANQLRALLWTPSSGLVNLGVLNGGNASLAFGVNADGSVVVGNANDGAAGNAIRAFRWTQTTGMVSLGTLNGGASSLAYASSADGSVVVGYANDGAASGFARAFRWTQASGMASLGTLNGGQTSLAAAVNDDGSVTVGSSSDGAAGNATRAFRWTSGTGMVSLGVLNGGSESMAGGVNGAGTVIVGWSRDGAASNDPRAFMWTQTAGMVSLGVLNGGNASAANAVNSAGNVVVGESADGASGNTVRPFRWTQSTGMQRIEDWLRANGVPVAVNITGTAYGVSGDGNVVVGCLGASTLLDQCIGSAFVARVSAPGGGVGSGVVTVADVQESLASSTQGATMSLSAASTVLNGAHSRPLARRVAVGKNTLWTSGDLGRDGHGTRDGGFGLAEFGVGRNFGAAQINLAAGNTWAKQELAVGGRAKTGGSYLLGEALISVAGNLWTTFGAYSHRGDADLHRGYMNAGLPDSSTGTPDLKTWGLRARVDWDKALQFAGAQITPYVDLSQTRATLAGYTETGGGFPARFDERKDKATELRFGANGEVPMSTELRLVGTLEAVHRFEKSASRTTGNLVGLFGFDLPGQAYDRTWLRAGIGLDRKLGDGIASFMFNFTTRGEAPNYWLAASWQLPF